QFAGLMHRLGDGYEMKNHPEISGMKRQAIEEFFGAGERHQDIDESEAVESEGYAQPDDGHVEIVGGVCPPGFGQLYRLWRAPAVPIPARNSNRKPRTEMLKR